MPDVLAPLLDLPDIAPAFDVAREAVDAAMRHRALRRSGGPVAAEVGLRCAVASAALEGHGYDLEQVRAGLVTDPVMQGALRASAALDGLTGVWQSAPRQALARLHTLVARDSVPVDRLGRPLAGQPRLDSLVDLVCAAPASTPVLLRAAVVHGELLTIGAFDGPNGVLARAAARLTLVAGGFDPRGLLAIDAGHHEREPEYIGSSRAYATGTVDGVRSWLRHYAHATTAAAAVLVEVCDAA